MSVISWPFPDCIISPPMQNRNHQKLIGLDYLVEPQKRSGVHLLNGGTFLKEEPTSQMDRSPLNCGSVVKLNWKKTCLKILMIFKQLTSETSWQE